MGRPVILLDAFTGEAALKVFRNLDWDDRVECDLMAGRFDPLSAVAQRMMASPHMCEARVASVLRETTGMKTPFAVICLAQTGYRGVASAEFLSCSYKAFWRELACLASMTRDLIAGIAEKHDLTRIEFRSWAGHPRAAKLGAALGFHREAVTPGYGPDGRVEGELWAWTRPTDQNSN